MAKDFKDYEELLRYFSDDGDLPKKPAADGQKKPAADGQKKPASRSTAAPRSASGGTRKPAAQPEKSERQTRDRAASRSAASRSMDLSEEIRRSEEARREKIRQYEESQKASRGEAQSGSAYKGEVYFSNPPREIRQQAAREKQAISADAQKPEAKPTPPPASRKQQLLKDLKAQKKAKRAERLKKIGINPQEGDSSRKKTFSSLLLILSIIVFFSVCISLYGIRCVNDILALKGDDTAVQVEVKAGATDRDIIRLLKKEDLIRNKLFCQLFVKVVSDRDEENEYVAGVYTLSQDMGLEKMLSTMQADYTLSDTVSLTFPEGWTADQIAEKLESNDVCTASAFLSTMESVDFSSEYTFLSSMGHKEQRFRVLEGYLYPDTYEFYVGEPAASVIRRFLDNFQSKWTDAFQKRASALEMSTDEVITLASILQKEAAGSSQMKGISSVLHNRLEQPDNFPWLNCDSTETYLLKTIKPSLTSSVEDTERYIAYRDAYDTYSEVCKGLPVGAIANPGIDAINAALHPDDTGYYYFQHDSEGKVYYARTLAEQEQISAEIS